MPHLVDMVSVTELVKCNKHGIEHADNLHGFESLAHGSEANYVSKQDTHTRQHLYTGKQNNGQIDRQRDKTDRQMDK